MAGSPGTGVAASGSICYDGKNHFHVAKLRKHLVRACTYGRALAHVHAHVMSGVQGALLHEWVATTEARNANLHFAEPEWWLATT